MYLNIAYLKIKIFCDFWGFDLIPVPKNENLEIAEMLQE